MNRKFCCVVGQNKFYIRKLCVFEEEPSYSNDTDNTNNAKPTKYTKTTVHITSNNFNLGILTTSNNQMYSYLDFHHRSILKLLFHVTSRGKHRTLMGP